MIRVGDRIAVSDDELQESFIRASGPGGQNVNKVSTAVQLRFDVRNAPGLPPDVRQRLERIAGWRLTRDGVLIITAQEHRSQDRNRQAARELLTALLNQAATAPKHRHATKTPYATRLRRLDDKKIRSQLKRNRHVTTES